MNTQKYYLRVNGNIIIKLDDYKKYDTMTDFVSLNLFTSDFDNIQDIGDELKRIGLLEPNVKVETIEIVHLYNDRYHAVACEPLFSYEYQYLDEKYVEDFFYRNTRHYKAMMLIINNFRKMLEEKLPNDDESKNVYGQMLEERLENIKRLEVLLNDFINKSSSYYEEYYIKLKKFVDGEIYYKRGNKKTINYRGLFEMAKNINVAFLRYPNLYKPKIQKPVTKVVHDNMHILDLMDPDEYMFLESDDFIGLYNGSEKYREPLEDQLENLEEKKKRL